MVNGIKYLVETRILKKGKESDLNNCTCIRQEGRFYFGNFYGKKFPTISNYFGAAQCSLSWSWVCHAPLQGQDDYRLSPMSRTHCISSRSLVKCAYGWLPVQSWVLYVFTSFSYQLPIHWTLACRYTSIGNLKVSVYLYETEGAEFRRPVRRIIVISASSTNEIVQNTVISNVSIIFLFLSVINTNKWNSYSIGGKNALLLSPAFKSTIRARSAIKRNFSKSELSGQRVAGSDIIVDDIENWHTHHQRGSSTTVTVIIIHK